MEYNPFTAKFEELKSNISSDEKALNEWNKEIEWYGLFDLNEANSSWNLAQRNMKSLIERIKELDEELRLQQIRTNSLNNESRPGLNPLYWFSKQRQWDKLNCLCSQDVWDELARERDSIQQQLDESKSKINKEQVNLTRYRSFDPTEGEATVKALSSRIAQLKSELELIQLQKESVDHQLRHLLEPLNELVQQKDVLEGEIESARELERQLNSAANSFQRKTIHDSCNATFGESKPASVIRGKQGALKAIGNNIEKLKYRLRSIKKIAERNISALVIDGNNLCYQQQTFIGLGAIQAAIQKLKDKYKIIVIFDATIRKHLKMHDRDIATYFKDAAIVHVVASKNKADETILDTAANSASYIISNDRFIDFPDKSAVREERLIRHEILDGKILIHDLNLDEKIATAQ